MKLRVTTFNCENLFGRYRFLEIPPGGQPKDFADDIQIFDVVTFEPGRSNKLKPKVISEAQRKLEPLAADRPQRTSALAPVWRMTPGFAMVVTI